MNSSESCRRTPTVGIVGAGQLARMTYQAAIGLGVRVRVLAERGDDAAALVARDVTIGSPGSYADLGDFAAACDVLTFDHELVDARALARLEAAGHRLRPGAPTVALAQNKIRQRALFADRGFPVPAHRSIGSASALLRFGEEHGWPVVVKAGRGGYDGRGVWVVPDSSAASDLIGRIDTTVTPLLAEAWVPIEREVAVLVARRPAGETAVYPVVETVQRDGICHELLVPAAIPAPVAAAATRLALDVAEAIDAVGMLALELFVVGGRLLINEIATRPHNSGHFSIEGCVTSQFEQQLRAVLDWPLGATTLLAPAVATVNVLGDAAGSDPSDRLPAALAVPGAHVHLYAKEPRPGRKLGHVTALGATAIEARRRALDAAARLTAVVARREEA